MYPENAGEEVGGKVVLSGCGWFLLCEAYFSILIIIMLSLLKVAGLPTDLLR